MSVEFTTPLPVTLHGMRFVFFFVEQPVADSFDNIPQFYLDIAEKASPENMQRLYVCGKPIILPTTFVPEASDEIQATIIETVRDFRSYVKKHFGSKFLVLETMPSGDDKDSLAVMETIGRLYRVAYMNYIEGSQDYFTASSHKESDLSIIQVSPASYSEFKFTFQNKESNVHSLNPVICTGNALLFGEPMIFRLDDPYRFGIRDKEYRLDVATIRKFITPGLIETVVNNTIRNAMGHPATIDDKYIHEVEIDEHIEVQ